VRRAICLALIVTATGCGRVRFADEPPASVDAAAAQVGFVAAGTPVGAVTGATQVMNVPVPAGVAANDLLILHVAHWQTSVPGPSGWTAAVPDFGDGYCNDSGMSVGYRIAASNEPATYAVTCPTYCSAVIIAIRGANTASPLDQIGPLARTTERTTTCGASVSPQLQVVPSVTSATPGDWVLLLYSDNNDAATQPAQALPAWWTSMYNFVTSEGAGQNILGGIEGPVAPGPSGPQTITVTGETMYGWTGVQVAIAPAP
jgi:hypothetical protein